MQKYEYPPDDVLKAGVETNGVLWTAEQIGCSDSALRKYLQRRGLPLHKKAQKLEVSDALAKVAKSVGG